MKDYIIEYGDKRFPASEYQAAIFDYIEHGVGNLVINACAGSSKTTTIINCLNKIDTQKRILFVAFNKSIVDEIKEKVTITDNINVTTFHSLGLSILREDKEYKDAKIDEFKYKNYIKNNIEELSPLYRHLSKADQSTYMNTLEKLIDYSRYFLVNKSKRILNVAQKYNMMLFPDEIDVCLKVLRWGRENKDVIDFTDMVWLPNVLNLTTRYCLYDFVFVDEGQDTSIMEENLIKRCYKRGVRTVVVGDIDQQINVWAGANSEAFDNFINEPNTKTLDLPICYRCPSKIIELAQQYTSRIMAAPNAINGEIRFNVSKNNPVNGDMVLCRTTAPLVDLHLRYIRLNKKSYIKGSEEIRRDYLRLIESTDADKIDVEITSKDGLLAKLYSNLFKKKDKLMMDYGLDDEDAISHPDFLKDYDAIEAIKVISEGIDTVRELRDKINVIFADSEEGIMLSTVHKAKGLESDNVYILYPSLMPSKMAKSEWEIRSERNLLYVSVTRAKKSLNYMEEGGRWSIKQGYMSAGAMLIYLSGIAEKIGYKFSEKTIAKIEEKKKTKEMQKTTRTENKKDKFDIRKLL